MNRIRERAQELESNAEERIKEILERPKKKKRKSKPTSPTWIDDTPSKTLGMPKSNIRAMLHGDVTTKSSTQRG